MVGGDVCVCRWLLKAEQMFVVGVLGEVEFYLRYAALPRIKMNLMLSSVLCVGHPTQSSGIKQITFLTLV